MIKYLLPLVWGIFFSWLQAQTNAGQLPSGFPVFTDTGHPLEDQERYAQKKAEWIKENPEAYTEIADDMNREMFPSSKWNTAEEKDKWVKEHPEEYKRLLNNKQIVIENKPQYNPIPLPPPPPPPNVSVKKTQVVTDKVPPAKDDTPVIIYNTSEETSFVKKQPFTPSASAEIFSSTKINIVESSLKNQTQIEGKVFDFNLTKFVLVFEPNGIAQVKFRESDNSEDSVWEGSYEKLNGQLKLSLTPMTCASCLKEFVFDILSWKGNTILLQGSDEDFSAIKYNIELALLKP